MFGGKLGLPEIMVVLVVCFLSAIFVVVPWFKIFSKSGHSGILSVLMLIPVVNLLLLWWFAFTTWPAQSSQPNATNPASR